jgi:hypothetical protein
MCEPLTGSGADHPAMPEVIVSQSGSSRGSETAVPVNGSGGVTSTSPHEASPSVLSGVMNDHSPPSRSRAAYSRTPYAISRGA